MFSLFKQIGVMLLICMPLMAQAAEPQPYKEDQASSAVSTSELYKLSQQLIDAGYREKQALVETLVEINDPQTLKFLQVMVDGDLYYRKDDRVIVINEDDAITIFFTGESITLENKRDIKKISVNNKLRTLLRGGIARLQIFSNNLAMRKQAATNLLKSADDLDEATLQLAVEKEKNADVQEILSLVQGIRWLEANDEKQRLAGVELLSGSLYPDVRGALANYVRAAETDERSTEVAAAKKALDKIEAMLTANAVVENLYFGLALGAVLLLAAIGLAITFGVMGVINMAHGEMIMLGAYTTYMVQQLMPEHMGVSLVVSIPAAFLISGLVGIAIERGVIRHLYGRPLETLLATFGISLILQQAVRSIFGPLNRDVGTPDWMAGTFMINPALELTYNRLYIIIFSLLVLAVLALILKRTLFGLQMRAVTMNRPMASSMGIRTGWVDALTFGLGSGIAGIAGVALSQLTNVGPNMGQAYIIDSFMVVVFGGVGNLWGTLVGAMSLGVMNKLLEPWAGAVVAKILMLVFIILFIQKRPRGLFALKGRAADMG